MRESLERTNRFSTLCKKWVVRKRQFVLERASWHDARFQNGTPVENKSTMIEHADGQPGNFKIYRQYHDHLRRVDGWYCFVVYRPHGRSGCTVLQDKLVRVSQLPLLRWHSGGNHRGTQQAKISITDIF
ncbi:hypothetical protein [Halomontanus rarus]|uniref:hypothetical protein n=1 Tax=Halomontanus rarus TaxID=3034020 RepID=UPI00293B8EBA|nr:hypothetical protein [Halovivax sp. KZCA124]